MKKVLIADDSATARMFIKKSFSVLGKDYEFLEASDGMEAYKLLHSNEVQLLVTDITMPNMSGHELIKVVFEEEVPVEQIIAVTSVGNEALENELKEFGVKIISKPISPAKLSEVLESEENEDDLWG
jgi:two-component system chemotaxis response regulator CheY